MLKSPDRATITRRLRHRLEQQAAQRDRGLFAILDAARAEAVPQKLQQWESDSVSLYRGDPEEELAHVAPYLVKLERGGDLLSWVAEEGWGRSWGVFFTASVSMEDLRRHFRRFLMVKNESGKRFYFRFYDPRILRVYLPTCTADEIKRFFGPVASFLVESEDGKELLKFSIRYPIVTLDAISLSALGKQPKETTLNPAPQSEYLVGQAGDWMLTIRNEQIKVFEEAALRNFEDQMVEHLYEFSPRHSEVLGEPAVRQVVRLGMDRAKKYGLTNYGPVRFYLELMFMLGSDFDTDLQLPWAGEILRDPTIPDQTVRADELYDKAMEYMDAVVGPHYEYEKEALRRASRLRFEDISVSGGNFENEVVRGLKMMYPQKCEYVGEPVLRALIQRGITLARRHSLSTDAGVALFIGLMFSFGHGSATDPQFPWIAATLNDTSITDPSRRIERLYSRMITYLREGLAYLEQS